MTVTAISHDGEPLKLIFYVHMSDIWITSRVSVRKQACKWIVLNGI